MFPTEADVSLDSERTEPVPDHPQHIQEHEQTFNTLDHHLTLVQPTKRQCVDVGMQTDLRQNLFRQLPLKKKSIKLQIGSP